MDTKKLHVGTWVSEDIAYPIRHPDKIRVIINQCRAKLAALAGRAGASQTIFLYKPKGPLTERTDNWLRLRGDPQPTTLREALHCDLYNVEREPSTLPLNRLHHIAFDDPDCGTFAYIDPQVFNVEDFAELPELEDRLVSFLQASIAADLAIGDYEPIPYGDTQRADVDFKKGIETRVRELLSGSFSELLDKWPEFGQITRVRSEFYGISKTLYKDLQAFPPIAYDYGLQALLVARQENRVVKGIDIGAVPEKKRYDGTKERDQVQRVEFQLRQVKNWFDDRRG